MRRTTINAFWLLFACVPVFAHVTVPIAFREMVAEAELIVRGHITDVRAVVVSGQGIDSIATVRVDETLNGDATSFVSVRVPGGEIGPTRFVFVGAPRLAANQSAVFFLKRLTDGTWSPVGLTAGIVPIRASPSTGRPSVQSPQLEPQAAGRAAPRGESPRALVPIEEFGALVRVMIAGQRRAVARPTP
jgi:hypothetical protein